MLTGAITVGSDGIMCYIYCLRYESGPFRSLEYLLVGDCASDDGA